MRERMRCQNRTRESIIRVEIGTQAGLVIRRTSLCLGYSLLEISGASGLWLAGPGSLVLRFQKTRLSAPARHANGIDGIQWALEPKRLPSRVFATGSGTSPSKMGLLESTGKGFHQVVPQVAVLVAWSLALFGGKASLVDWLEWRKCLGSGFEGANWVCQLVTLNPGCRGKTKQEYWDWNHLLSV